MRHFNAVEEVNALLTHALSYQASDIHFDPGPQTCRVRMRIDGLLKAHRAFLPSEYQAILTRIKTLSGLDIAQQRTPQDGRLGFYHQQYQAQFRVHSCASIHGEKSVLRLIQIADQCLTLDQLGFLPEQIKPVTNMLTANQGLVIVCGPTGSGKTMTLYAMLNYLMQRELQIITLEDPVEIVIEGLSQLQIHRKQHLDFATLLRACLRQDPDVIMIGEIRDEETAQIAVRAALTGHLVLSSLHTPHTQASVTRLKNMGIASYDLEECLRGVIAQRLVRVQHNQELKGRTGIFECYQPHMDHLSLEQVAHIKVQAGVTTEAEIRRVL